MRETKILRNTRTLAARAVSGLSQEQLLEIPTGFRNNILWNLGHLIVTQQVLHYDLAGQPMYVSEELVAQCRAGTSPADWSRPPDLAELLNHLETLPDRLDEDYAAGRFSQHRGFTSRSTGVHLPTIEEVIDFDNYHEGLHLGVILTYRKLVA